LLPLNQLKSAENKLDFTTRFMMTEEFKDLPFGTIWNEFCRRMNVPTGLELLKELDNYKNKVATRS